MMARDNDRAAGILDAALALAAERRWEEVTLGEIAAAAEVRLSEMFDRFPSKLSIVRAFMRRTDARVLDTTFAFDDEDSPRDRLFDILMSRFDALGEHKRAVLGIADAYGPGSLEALLLLPDLLRSMSRMLEAAGISAEGPGGFLRTKGLVAVWFAVGRVWADDDSPDLARTMAALDRQLRRWERLTQGIRLPRRFRPGPRPRHRGAARSGDEGPLAGPEARPGE